MFEGIDLFSSLTQEEQDKLSLFCQLRYVKSWEVLFEEGDTSTSMYIVKKWLLQAFTWERLLWKIGPSEIVWEMALFDEPQYRSATVSAVDDTELIVILTYSLEQLIQKHSDIIAKIRAVIQKRKSQNLQL